LLTAIGLTLGGSSTVQYSTVQYTFTHKKYVEQHNRHKKYIEKHKQTIHRTTHYRHKTIYRTQFTN